MKHSIDGSTTWSKKIQHYLQAPVEQDHNGWNGELTDGIRATQSLNVSKFDRVLIDGRLGIDGAAEVSAFLHKDSIVFLYICSDRPFYHNITTNKNYRLILQTFEGRTLAIFESEGERINFQSIRTTFRSFA